MKSVKNIHTSQLHEMTDAVFHLQIEKFPHRSRVALCLLAEMKISFRRIVLVIIEKIEIHIEVYGPQALDTSIDAFSVRG